MQVQKTIEDIGQKSIIRGQVLNIGDINAHSTMYNPHSWQPKNAGPLQELIKGSKLIVNNDIDFLIRLSSQGISIIDLAFIIAKLVFFKFGKFIKITHLYLIMNLFY